MAFALVGVAGAPVQGAVNTAVTPAYGQTPTAGNRLILFVSITGSVTQAGGFGTGWVTWATSSGNSTSVSIATKIAVGGDAAPTVAADTTGVISAHLEEWSGGEATNTRDQSHTTASGTTSPITATFNAADAAAGELVAMAAADFRSAARAPNDTWTSNHGTPTLQASNNGVSSTNHYSHATLITNSNSGADTAVLTASVTTSITGLSIAAASFKLAPPPPASQPYVRPYPPLLAQ